MPKLYTFAQRLIVSLKLFKHDWSFIGTGNVYDQPTAYYTCTKCGNTVFTVKGHKALNYPKRGCIR